MLAVILTYHSFFEFLPLQLQNLKTHIKVPFKIYLIDNSLIYTVKYSAPEITYLFCKEKGSPSQRHQAAVNLGLSAAWGSCDSFLIFDNDMIFLEDYKPPGRTHYLAQQRGEIQYAWLNLLFFKKDERLRAFDFAVCPKTGQRTDSGGSFYSYLLDGDPVMPILTLQDKGYFPDFTERYKDLCEKHKVLMWYDIFELNHAKIFHFRALSNWTNFPPAFQEEKKQLILRSVAALQN